VSQKPGIALLSIFGDGVCKTLRNLRANRVLGADSPEGAFIELFRRQHELARSYQRQFFRCYIRCVQWNDFRNWQIAIPNHDFLARAHLLEIGAQAIFQFGDVNAPHMAIIANLALK